MIKSIYVFLFATFVFPLYVSGTEIEIVVKGMVCAFCAQGITKKFKARAEVTDVKVSLENKSVHLSLAADKSLSDDQINEIIKNSGYNVDSITRSK